VFIIVLKNIVGEVVLFNIKLTSYQSKIANTKCIHLPSSSYLYPIPQNIHICNCVSLFTGTIVLRFPAILINADKRS